MKRLALCVLTSILWSTPVVANTITAAQKAQKSIVSVTAERRIKDEQGTPGLLTQNGAGVVLDSTGILVTNFHTVQNMEHIRVQLFDGIVLKAHLVKVMPAHDLVLLKILSPKKLYPIEFADARTIRLHLNIIHVGHSFWLKGALSGGKIVGIGKNKTTQELDVFELNLDLYPGDSGGPVLNNAGQLLGMMTAKRTDRHNSSYAIPAHKIKQLYLTR